MYNDYLNEIALQQMQSQGYYNQQQYQQQMYQQQSRRVTKKDLVDWLKWYYKTENVVMVDEMETRNARHICPSGRAINIIPVVSQPIQTPQGYVYANTVYCKNCGKLIVDKNSLDML